MIMIHLFISYVMKIRVNDAEIMTKESVVRLISLVGYDSLTISSLNKLFIS